MACEFFTDDGLGWASPYGVANNAGWVSVGLDNDTASLAAKSTRRRWKIMSFAPSPARGQAFDHRRFRWQQRRAVRLWKCELQTLADELRIPISVCHLPAGSSKWNKIEHRLFSFITQNWGGKPLISLKTIVRLIAATTTEADLKVRCEVDPKTYPPGVKVADREMDAIALGTHSFHGDWDYTIQPNTPRSNQ